MSEQLQKLIERETKWIELLGMEHFYFKSMNEREDTAPLDKIQARKRLLEIEAELETHQQYLTYYQNHKG